MLLKFRRGTILIWLLVFFLIIGLLGGGLYYYLEVYTPAQYAKAVIPIYDQIRSQQVDTGNLKGSSDYEGILIILDQYQASFTQRNDELSKLKPSLVITVPSFLTNTKRSQQIQEDFTKILDVFISNIANAKKQTQFMIKAKQLFLLLRPDLTTYPPKAELAGQGTVSPPPPSTAGEYLAVWEVRTPEAKAVAKDLFSQPTDLGNVSFDELKSLWLETEQGFDAVILFLKKQDPNLPLSEAQKLVPENEKPLFDKVDKIDEFLPLLENLLIRNSGENILEFYLFASDSVSQSDFNSRTRRLDATINDLKEKYD